LIKSDTLFLPAGGERMGIGNDYELAPATRNDITEMIELQDRNLVVHGGSLTVAFSRELFQAAMAEMPVVVARRAGRLVGYVLSGDVASQLHIPIFAAMRRAYSGSLDAYLYGPICVDEGERGRGLARALFADLCVRLPGREGISFIRSDNKSSLQAHKKMGWQQVAEFTQDGTPFVVIVCSRQ
jgi:L-amino acid N-acyltransferase YncA